LALFGGFRAYVAMGQAGGSQSDTVTVTAEPTYSPPTGGGVVGEWDEWDVECPAGQTSTAGKVTSKGVVTKAIITKSFDGRMRLTIDEGITALTSYGKCLRCIGIHEMEEPPPPPEDAKIIGLVYDIGPHGATFAPPVSLTLTYAESLIPAGVAEEHLVLAMWDAASGQWIPLKVFIADPETNIITGLVSHSAPVAILGYARPPAVAIFAASSLLIIPTEVNIGETVNIIIVVTNTGGQSGNYQVILKINGVVEADRDIALDAGAVKQVSFSTSKDTAGTYSVDVCGLTGSFEVKQKPVPPVTPPVTPPVEPTPAKPTNWWLIGGIIAAAAVAAFGGYLFRKRLLRLLQRLSPLLQGLLHLLQRMWLQIRRAKIF